MRNTNTASIGFRAKTGRAIAVALAASANGPSLIWRREVSLVHPDVTGTAQPYHEVMELPWPESIAAVKPFIRAIDDVAATMLQSLIEELESQGFTLHAIGVVGSLDRNLEKIGNPHIRAHAAEGILFRSVLETAAKTHRIACRSYSDQTLTESAVSAFSRKALESRLKALGAQAGSPWRGEQKAAATAAWLALETSRR